MAQGQSKDKERQRRLEFKEEARINEMIRSHCDLLPNKRHPGRTLVEYQPGWNDARIAQELSDEFKWSELPATTITRWRRKNVGDLAHRGRYANDGSSGVGKGGISPILRVALQARERVDNLEPRVALVEEAIQIAFERMGILLPNGFGEAEPSNSQANRNETDEGEFAPKAVIVR